MPIKTEKTDLKTNNKPANTHTIVLQEGRVPPQSIDLECAVLGGIMVDESALYKVIDILSPSAFYDTKHQKIFEAILKLFEDKKPVDLLTVSDQLRAMGNLNDAGGDYYLTQLTQTVASSAHIEHHTHIIIEKFIRRELIKVSGEISTESFKENTDVFDLLDNVESKIFDISQGNIKKGVETANNLVLQAIQEIKDSSEKKGVIGLPTGFKELDDLTSGWQPSDLIILGARPGMGKTAFILSETLHIALRAKKTIAIFSLEMSSVQLMKRMISNETGLNSKALRDGNLHDYQWELLRKKSDELRDAPIFIDDSSAISIFDLRTKAKRLKSQHDIQLIVIDYLQLMTVGNNKFGNREQEISIISRNLKALAKELEIPIIALSQLSRSVETRGGNKRPQLSDLRESGAIEQDADIVAFLYRPEYYGIMDWDDEYKTPSQGQAEIIVAKHRNGNTGNIRIQFIAKYSRFTDLQTAENGHFISKHNESKTSPEEAFDKHSSQNKESNDEVPF